jgi:hypothetical protein
MSEYDCPLCLGPSILVFTAPKVEWLICKRCRVCWPGGYGIWSAWERYTDDSFAWAREELTRYMLVADEGAEACSRYLN